MSDRLENVYLRLVFIIFFCVTTFGKNLESIQNDNRIVGGQPASDNQFPFQVSIRRSYNNAHFCAGSIISLKHILTAAHCMYYVWGGPLPPQLVTILADLNSSNIQRNVSEINLHPDYDKTSMANDLAILKLTQLLPDDNKFISIVSLQKDISISLSCTVSGWGYQSYTYNELSNILLVAKVETIEFSACYIKYQKINISLVDGMLCAENNKQISDACQGDSGGPLVCDGFLTGVVSAGRDCGNTDYPGVYSNISYFFSWIDNVINVGTNIIQVDSQQLPKSPDNILLPYIGVDISNDSSSRLSSSVNQCRTSMNLMATISVVCLFRFAISKSC